MTTKNNFWLLCLMVFLAAITRLVPHPANFTAIGALALFSGAYFENKRTAFIVPLAAMLFSDILMEALFRMGIGIMSGFHSSLPYVYLGFVLSVTIGFWIKQQTSIIRILSGSLAASIIFFAISNFAVWLSGYYGFTTQGFITCYIAAIPFFQNSLLGDLFFTTVLFGSFEWLKKAKPNLAFVKA